MKQELGYGPMHDPPQHALAALERFCTAAKISFDRTSAARALYEAERAIPGDDWPTWSRRLVEVGESVHLRVRSVESSLDDALQFVRHGIPVVTCTQSPTGQLKWIQLVEARGSRVRRIDGDDANTDSWVSLAALRR